MRYLASQAHFSFAKELTKDLVKFSKVYDMPKSSAPAMNAPDDQIATRNITILVALQGLVGTMVPSHFIIGGLAGKELASSAAFATFPISMTIIGSMFSAPLLSNLMTKRGRVPGFVLAAIIALIGQLLAAYAMFIESFPLLLVGAFFIGSFVAAQGLFRFAATDMASASFRPRAISFTVAGGLLAAIIGPTIASQFSTSLPQAPYAGAYLVTSALTFLFFPLFFLLKLPKPKANEVTVDKAAFRELLRSKEVVAAILVATISYAMMNLMMTATPLAVVGCGFQLSDSSNIVRAHVIAMYLPSFFTGYLINRFGTRAIAFTGLGLLTLASVIGMMGVQLTEFYTALILLGFGWNFGFVGGTNMLARVTDDPAMQKKLQGRNDFILWTSVAIASLTAGVLMNGIGDGGKTGWLYVTSAMLPFLGLAAFVLYILTNARKAQNA